MRQTELIDSPEFFADACGMDAATCVSSTLHVISDLATPWLVADCKELRTLDQTLPRLSRHTLPGTGCYASRRANRECNEPVTLRYTQ